MFYRAYTEKELWKAHQKTAAALNKKVDAKEAGRRQTA